MFFRFMHKFEVRNMKPNRIFDFFSVKSIPVPPNRYIAGSEFPETVRALLSQGSVSMGIGKMITQEDHDRLYESLKDYKFSDSQ